MCFGLFVWRCAMIAGSFDRHTPALINPRIGEMTKITPQGASGDIPCGVFARYFDFFANMISLLNM